MRLLVWVCLLAVAFGGLAVTRRERQKKCMKALEGFVKMLPAFRADVKESSYTSAIKHLLTSLPMMTTIATECEDTESIRASFELSVSHSTSHDCINDALQLVPVLKKTVEDLKEHSYFALLGDANIIYSKSEKLATDCENVFTGENATAERDMKRFVADVLLLTPLLEGLAGHLSAGDVSKIIMSLPHIVVHSKEVLADAQSIAGMRVADLNNETECAMEALALAPLINDTLPGFKTGNVSSLVEDVEEILEQLGAMTTACSNVNPPDWMNFRLSDTESCQKELNELRRIALEGYQLYKEGQVLELTSLAQSAVETFRRLPDVCDIHRAGCEKSCSFERVCREENDCATELRCPC